jgi:hypothetical protein
MQAVTYAAPAQQVVYEQPQAQAVTYAAPQAPLVYEQAQSTSTYEQAQPQVVTYGASAQSVYEQSQPAVTYAAPSSYEAPAVTYAAPSTYATTQQVAYEQPQTQAMTYAMPSAQPVYEQQAVGYSVPAQTSAYEQQVQQPAVQYAASTSQPIYEQSQPAMYTGGAAMQAASFAVPGQMSYAPAMSAAPMAMTQPNNLSFIPPAMGQQPVSYQQYPGTATESFAGQPAMGMTGMGMMQQTVGTEGMEPAVTTTPAPQMPVQEPLTGVVPVKSKRSKKLVTKKTRKDCC